jgi:hypothetical protein
MGVPPCDYQRNTAFPVRNMSISQLRPFIPETTPKPREIASWPGDCLPGIHQPFASMFPASQTHTTILPEVSVVSCECEAKVNKVSGASTRISARGPVQILCGVAIFCLIGIALGFWLRTVPGGRQDPRLTYNVFYVLFARNEPVGLGLVALFSVASAFVLGRDKKRTEIERVENIDRASWLCVALAIVAFTIAAAGTHVVLHDYALTADEYLADFQAKIFLRGKFQAKVPPALQDVVRVITPTYVAYNPLTHAWNSPYLPVYAAMRALFQYVDLQSLLNPLLAAVTVLALYGVARNIWPESKISALVAMALLVSSSQFLLMSMTAYSMPAHLALNTIWLWLYSRPDRRAFYLAPFVGVLAIGLHQPIVHALFVLPFLVRLVFQRRWRAIAVFSLIYGVGCAGWFVWKMHFQPPTTKGVESIFRLLNPRMLVIQPMDLLLIIGWASLATPLLAILGFRRVFHLPPILQDAAASCMLTFGFYYFFYLDQAHGWGYRYFHGVIVCLILLAVAGFNQLSVLVGQVRARTFVLVGVVISFCVQLPLRCSQVEAFVRPFARTAAVFHALPTKTVAFDGLNAWYAGDLIRNDPFLEDRPIVVSLYGLTPAAVIALEKMGSVRFISRDDLTRLGMFTTRFDHYGRDPFQLGQSK